MIRLLGLTGNNAWKPKELNMDLVVQKAREIIHTPHQDVCIILEFDNYFEVIIYNEYVSSSNARYIVAPDYYWSWDEEIEYEELLKNECTAYDTGVFYKFYEKYSTMHPEWHLKFKSNGPLRMIDHIRHCMQPGSAKEILYKAGLDVIAAHLSSIDEYNLIGNSPSDILSGLSIRLLRSINCPAGIQLISTEKKRKTLLLLQNRYSWLFDEIWNDSMCRYMNMLLDNGEDEKTIIRKFRKHYQTVHMFWSPSQFDYFSKKIQIKEDISKEIGAKLCENIRENELYKIHELLIRENDYWNERIEESNQNRYQNYVVFDDEYSLTYPKSIKEFVIEAIEQQNCLLSYLDDYVENYTDIMFLRKTDSYKSPYVTVEIYDGSVCQAFLKCNKKPADNVLRWLSDYANKRKLSLDLDYDEYGYQ